MHNLKVSIIIPTYKEASNIPTLVMRIHKALVKESLAYEIIIVDDNSSDGIDLTVKELQQSYPIKIIIRMNKRGLASAVMDGIKASKGEIMVVMDADLSHPPEKIPKMLFEICKERADFVIGSRFVSGGGTPHFNYYRKLNAFVSKLLASPLTRVKDPLAGFFAFRKELLTNFDELNPVGFKIGLEILIKTNPKKVVEIPISFEERIGGKSKLSLKEQMNYLIHLHRLYQFKFTKIMQLVDFALVGCLGMSLDLLTVFITYEFFKLPYRQARFVGFFLAASLNFSLNRSITFRDTKNSKFMQQYVLFLSACLMGMLANWSISIFLFENIIFFNRHYLWAAFLGVFGGFCINFLGSKMYVFNKK